MNSIRGKGFRVTQCTIRDGLVTGGGVALVLAVEHAVASATGESDRSRHAVVAPVAWLGLVVWALLRPRASAEDAVIVAACAISAASFTTRIGDWAHETGAARRLRAAHEARKAA
jgi:hypothetical protein